MSSILKENGSRGGREGDQGRGSASLISSSSSPSHSLSPSTPTPVCPRQAEEIDSLEMIFVDIIELPNPHTLLIHILPPDSPYPSSSLPSFDLSIHLPPLYPEDPSSFPFFSISSLNCCSVGGRERREACAKELKGYLDECVRERGGEEVLYDVIESARDWLMSHQIDSVNISGTSVASDVGAGSGTGVGEEREVEKGNSSIFDDDFDIEEDMRLISDATSAASLALNGSPDDGDDLDGVGEEDDLRTLITENIESQKSENENERVGDRERETEGDLADVSSLADVCGGGWNTFCIGFVGKPSSGKSTLFNAATNPSDPARFHSLSFRLFSISILFAF